MHLAILMCAGIVLSLYYGREGLMPLDQSIVFDGGWRVLSGQIPYNDFSMPCGIVPVVMQAGVFGLLGVSWFSYCLHAAVINGLFCIGTYVFLRQCGVAKWMSLLYGLLSGLILYPPIGTPFMEQHAGFFLLISMILLAQACRTEGMMSSAMWALSAIGLVVSFFCKQNVPLVGILPLLVVFLFSCRGWRDTRRMILYIPLGVLVSLSIFLTVAWITGMDWVKLWTYMVVLPYQLMAQRILWRGDPASGLRHQTTAILIVCLVVGMVGIGLLRRRASERIWVCMKYTALGMSLLLFCALFTEVTSNQASEGLWYLFVSIGLIHHGALAALPDRDRRITSLCMNVFFLSFVLKGAYLFNSSVNMTRVANDMILSTEAKHPRARAMRFAKYQAPVFYCTDAEDLDNVIAFFDRNEGNFFLFGDMSILYGVTGRPSVLPSLWYHDGLATPTPGTPLHGAFDRELVENLICYKVKYIVLEPNGTWNGTRLQDLSKTAAFIDEHAIDRFNVGSFRLVKLDVR